jgi:hypothetical protein
VGVKGTVGALILDMYVLRLFLIFSGINTPLFTQLAQ